MMFAQPLDFWTPSVLILRTGGDDRGDVALEAIRGDLLRIGQEIRPAVRGV